MKNLNEVKLEELKDQELLVVSGGNWLHDLGAAAHEAWNEVQEFFCELPEADWVNSSVHGPNGNKYM